MHLSYIIIIQSHQYVKAEARRRTAHRTTGDHSARSSSVSNHDRSMLECFAHEADVSLGLDHVGYGAGTPVVAPSVT